MSKKQFINNLSATYADVRKLDVKKINLKGKNILEYIEESTPTIKHSKDTRETVTENDLWGQWVETTDDGTIIVHDDWLANPNANTDIVIESAWNSSITKVEDNKAYVNDTFFANIQTEKLKDGYGMFVNCLNLTNFQSSLSNLTDGYGMFVGTAITTFPNPLNSLTNGSNMFFRCLSLTSFSSDLPSLTDGTSMFNGCRNLATFSSDLPSLTDGTSMFNDCMWLTSFSSDLPSLTNGTSMFFKCGELTSVSSDLPSLTNGTNMFTNCFNLISFSSNLSSLTNGSNMFSKCEELTSFSSDLPSLTNGTGMFDGCRLDAPSLANIIHTINTPTEQGAITIGLGIVDTDEARQTLAEAIWCKDWNDVNQEFSNKNWTVTWLFNGVPTA